MASCPSVLLWATLTEPVDTLHPEHTGTISSLSLVCLWLSLRPRIILLTYCGDRSGAKSVWTNSFSLGVLLRLRDRSKGRRPTLTNSSSARMSTTVYFCYWLIFPRITSHNSHRRRGKNKFAWLWVVWVGGSRVQWNIFLHLRASTEICLGTPLDFGLFGWKISFLNDFRWTVIVTVMTITHLIIRNLSGGISLSRDFDSDLMTAASLWLTSVYFACIHMLQF